MAKKTNKPTKGRRAAKTTEYRFTIDAFTPDTLPMARLAEYMADLAVIVGERESVHFVAVAPGSAVQRFVVENPAVPKVDRRILSVANNDPPPDAARAFRQLNHRLRDDNAIATLNVGAARKPLLKFPGRDEKVDADMTIRQHGTLDGKLVRIGGTDDTIHATLFSEGQRISNIHLSEPKAKQLAARLFEYVRLVGTGKWTRGGDGSWRLDSFKVDSFEPLKDTPLSEVLDKIRSIGVGWEKGTAKELWELRHGPGGDPDARH